MNSLRVSVFQKTFDNIVGMGAIIKLIKVNIPKIRLKKFWRH